MENIDPYSSPESRLDVGVTVETYQPKFFALKGRIGRMRYLAYGMVVSVIGCLLIFPPMIMMIASGERASPDHMLLAFRLSSLILALPNMIIMKRRLNDLDHSGWWALLFFVPIVNALLGLYLLFRPGREALNRFGPPPAPNTRGIIFLGVGVPILVMLMGILAAIAIPQYQAYIKHTHQMQPQ